MSSEQQSQGQSTAQIVIFDHSQQQGRLEMTGRDRLDLLHRMSTNDLLTMQPGDGRSTVLTTALARIIDRLIVYQRGDTALLITNYPEPVRAWLQKHIFFRDQVKLRNVSAELGQLEVYGPAAAAEIANAAGIPAESLSRLALHQFVEAPGVPVDGGPCLIARTFPLVEEGYMLVAPSAALDRLRAAMQAELGTEANYEKLRIQAGLPGSGHELTEDYIPLEANLWDSVSFTKGCYIGQEIIARMDSRHRLAKTLVCLRLSAAVPAGSTLYDEADRVGALTSITPPDDDDGAPVALGFVKPDRAEPGVRLRVQTDSGELATAEIIPARLLVKHR